MKFWMDFIIISVALLNLLMLSSSRISTCIRIVAAQGILVGLLSIMTRADTVTAEAVILCFISICLKGFVFPWLLYRAQREANIRKEVEPIGGYPFSLIIGAGLILISYWLSVRLPYTRHVISDMLIPVSFATLLTGVFVIVSRSKALTQVTGYLMLENGIYLFGAALLIEQSLLVELAILLDIFVAVFVMGIAIFHISREFDHIDTQDLSELKDWVSPEEE